MYTVASINRFFYNKVNTVKSPLKSKNGEYQNPRISVNSLCEYNFASPTRRNSIINNSKEKPVFIAARYNDVEDVLSFYLANIRNDPKVLANQIHALITSKFRTEFEQKCALLSADALSSFLSYEHLVYKALSVYSPKMSIEETKNKMLINGVQISIRPEIKLYDSSLRQQLGFIKFYICKSIPLTQERGELIACLGKYYFESEEHLQLMSKNCLVLDVFRGTIISAPKSYIKRIADVKASCQEIADRW